MLLARADEVIDDSYAPPDEPGTEAARKEPWPPMGSQGMDMVDRHTKAVLTIIAAALTTIAARDLPILKASLPQAAQLP
jgi:hypothetical protein